MKLRNNFILTCAAAIVGCGGGDEPISYTPVSATNDGGLYTLQLGALKLVIDGTRGARITEWSLKGTNVLVTRDENDTYGSTYWPSPQSSWCAGGVRRSPSPRRVAISGTSPRPSRATPRHSPTARDGSRT